MTQNASTQQHENFLNRLRSQPETIEFSDTMNEIDVAYDFTETAFSNGQQQNAAGENNGSCKLFAFAKELELTEPETLACFGTYYRNDVLSNPTGTDHQNIRNFITHGWPGIVFQGTALQRLA